LRYVLVQGVGPGALARRHALRALSASSFAYALLHAEMAGAILSAVRAGEALVARVGTFPRAATAERYLLRAAAGAHARGGDPQRRPQHAEALAES
jgi:hypothetical protein